MVRLTGVLNRLDTKKILVVGDFMLDTYTLGKVRRISPEAPVAVLQVQSEEHRPGGAGNVALNLISMGALVVALGRIGDDMPGALLKEAFLKEGVDVCGLVTQIGYGTPVKNRIIADNQQIVRVDHENVTPLPEMLEQQIYEKLPSLVDGVQLVAISDYGKGFLSTSLLSALIEYARGAGIPVISDPKGIDFAKYSGSTLIKPNLSEAYSAANMAMDAPLELVAEKVLQLSQAGVLMITRSECGISLFYKEGKRLDFPVCIREVKDVTGAGDTVLAMLAYALANGLTLPEATQLSNIAAGIAIERVGCARVTLGDVARRLLQFDGKNKIFDEEHVFALKKALEKKPYTLLSLSGAQGLTSGVFNAIQRLSKECEELLIFVRDVHFNSEFVTILAALHNVNFIFLNSEGLKNLFQHLSPQKMYVLDSSSLQQVDAEAALFY